MIKNGKRIQTHRRPFCTPVHPNPMQICASAWIYRWTKKLWKIRTGPPGRPASGALGLRAAGPLGRRGPWAAGRGPAFSKTPRNAN